MLSAQLLTAQMQPEIFGSLFIFFSILEDPTIVWTLKHKLHVFFLLLHKFLLEKMQKFR